MISSDVLIMIGGTIGCGIVGCMLMKSNNTEGFSKIEVISHDSQGNEIKEVKEYKSMDCRKIIQASKKRREDSNNASKIKF